jgi:4-hydroxythreonine-4-phosphate dehydrogenase
MSIPRLFITPGEPAGIGPELIADLLKQKFAAELVIIADYDLLKQRNNNFTLSPITDFDAPPQSGSAHVFHVPLSAHVTPGQLNLRNATYVINTLDYAIDFCLEKKGDAIVTGPVQKSILNEAGVDFTGHTEYLAKRTKTEDFAMLFLLNKLKVALLTTHLPLSKVPAAITPNRLKKIIRLLNKNFNNPHITVCGLNPHAGENGHLGKEEKDIIMPTLEQLRKENKNIFGPLPADTVFTPDYLDNTDIVLAMYHDQALPVVKYMGRGDAVNMTLGLPFVRTSVDHGTALDIAGTHRASASSLIAAVDAAIRLSFPGA